MLQKNSLLTPTEIYSAPEATAGDMDDLFTPGFDIGFDFGIGHGFVNALAAVNSVPMMAPSPTTAPPLTTAPPPTAPKYRIRRRFVSLVKIQLK